MATIEEAIRRLSESKPPATDRFTYLTIIEKSLSPELLPALYQLLDDAELTADIGWDLVEMLIPVPGSGVCLERIARLGNPREVILKVLEAMEVAAADGGHGDDNDDDDDEENGNEQRDGGHHRPRNLPPVDTFVTLCRMLGILHRRLRVKSPSRFLHSTLATVCRCYDPTSAEATGAVLSLIQALSGQKRPPLPSRASSTVSEVPQRGTGSIENAPDPEADPSAASEPTADEAHLVRRLLRSFVTCVIEAYVNANNLEWASRLLEVTYPQRIVPGRQTMMQAFKELELLQERDALVGQLAAAAGDLGLSAMSRAELDEVFQAPLCRKPLSSMDFDPQRPEDIRLSTGGLVCLLAYWIFAVTVFDADQPLPEMHLFPEHEQLLTKFLGGEDPQAEVVRQPGTAEGLVVMTLWLVNRNLISRGAGQEGETGSNFMAYHHLLTLISVLHPDLGVRNAATVAAGLVLHADPDEDDRLTILEDLLENCIFATLQACAVTWLREEMMAARKAGRGGRFASPDCFETLQYSLFPSLIHLRDADRESLEEYWMQNAPFHLQVVNFAIFLGGDGGYKELLPEGMAAAIEHRYLEPLQQVARTLAPPDESPGKDPETETAALLAILADRLERVSLQ